MNVIDKDRMQKVTLTFADGTVGEFVGLYQLNVDDLPAMEPDRPLNIHIGRPYAVEGMTVESPAEEPEKASSATTGRGRAAAAKAAKSDD